MGYSLITAFWIYLWIYSELTKMDFPPFHLDLIGNRMLIAVIAILHVLINHAMAVGAMPLITLLAWWGYRHQEPRWDDLAYKILAVCFIITTTVGALTGVGIWLSTSLVNPYAIGSLIRIFFWGWFAEWLVFVTEVSLIMAFFLTWKGWGRRHKARHIGLGVVLSIASWLTMAIIVAILGFMMDSGSWTERHTLIDGLLNPIYLPQLLFRTPYAMMVAGLFALLLVGFFTAKGPFRAGAIRLISLWTLVWVPLCIVGAVVYWQAIPETMLVNLPVALATQVYEGWYRTLSLIILAAAIIIPVIALWGVIFPRTLPRPALVVPLLLGGLLLGYFERVREFIRKPEVIENYMYANGLQRAAYPLYREEGLLAHAAYTPVRLVDGDNQLVAGRQLFMIACTRCHTTSGMNGVVKKLNNLYQHKPPDAAALAAYLRGMHNTRPFMPPVPGNDAEIDALAAYLIAIQTQPVALPGAQTQGVSVPPVPVNPESPTTPRPSPDHDGGRLARDFSTMDQQQ